MPAESTDLSSDIQGVLEFDWAEISAVLVSFPRDSTINKSNVTLHRSREGSRDQNRGLRDTKKKHINHKTTPCGFKYIRCAITMSFPNRMQSPREYRRAAFI